jgi:hypothetical protein
VADDRTYIRVHDGMDDHPKIEPLSDKAFRSLFRLWFWCSRHLTDGLVPQPIWERRADPKVRKELLAAGLAERVDGGVQMHDYLEHQRSAAQVDEIKESRGAASAKANHVRWHVRKAVVDPSCPHCPSPPNGVRRSSVNGSDSDSVRRSESDPIRSPETETETERTTKGRLRAAAARNVRPGDHEKTPPPPNLQPLREALDAAGLTVRWDKLGALQRADIAQLLAAHSVGALVAVAQANYRPNDPPAYAQAWIGAWQAMPPPNRPRLAAVRCAEHGETEPCRGCASERIAGDAS